MGRGMWRGPTGRYCRNRTRQAFNNEWRKTHPKNEPPNSQEPPSLWIVAIMAVALLMVVLSK